MGNLDEALRLALLRDLRGPGAAGDFADKIVAALELADHVYPRDGHAARVMTVARDVHADWVAFHQRREARDRRLAPARRAGLAAFEAANERLAASAPAHAWSPVVASVFGEDRPELFIW